MGHSLGESAVTVKECASGEAVGQRWGLSQEGAVTQGERCLTVLSPDTRILLHPCVAGPRQVSEEWNTWNRAEWDRAQGKDHRLTRVCRSTGWTRRGWGEYGRSGDHFKAGTGGSERGREGHQGYAVHTRMRVKGNNLKGA